MGDSHSICPPAIITHTRPTLSDTATAVIGSGATAAMALTLHPGALSGRVTLAKPRRVRSKAGTVQGPAMWHHVATLSPVTTVGEMGIVTRQVRRATVATLEASNVLVIKRTAFESVLSADKAAEARIYRNIVDILADKIVQDNVCTRDYLVEKVRQEERIREARRRADLALELVVSEAGMDRTRAQAIIDDHIDNEPRLRVLIVDDEAEMRRMLCDALADYDTSEARDGEEALEEIGDDPPDLVITDIRMPGMDGYELVRKLKERSPETPVLAISGYVSDADIVDYEFDAFLEKPMNLKEFRDFVDVALAEEE